MLLILKRNFRFDVNHTVMDYPVKKHRQRQKLTLKRLSFIKESPWFGQKKKTGYVRVSPRVRVFPGLGETDGGDVGRITHIAVQRQDGHVEPEIVLNILYCSVL